MNTRLRFTVQTTTGCHPTGESGVTLSLKLGSKRMGMDQSRDTSSRYSHPSERAERLQFGADRKELLEILSFGLSKPIAPKFT